MGLIARLREMLFAHVPDPDVIAARELAKRIGEHADAITDGAGHYTRHKDPFAALMADMYNRDQLSRLHHGPPA